MKSKAFSKLLKPSPLNYVFIEKFLVIILSILCIFLTVRFNQEQSNLRLKIYQYLNPIFYVLSLPVNQLDNFLIKFQNWHSLKDKNEFLKNQIIEYKQRINELNQLKVENEELQKLLNFSHPPATKKIVSRIIVDSSNIFSSKVFIDIGSKHNVTINSPVFNENGLLGRVINVQDKVSEVLLSIDPQSSIPVISEISNIKFFAEGAQNFLSIKHKQNSESFINNENVLSTDASGYFKEGIVVGKISKNEDNEYMIIPTANKHDSVYVMTVVYDFNKSYPFILE